MSIPYSPPAAPTTPANPVPLPWAELASTGYRPGAPDLETEAADLRHLGRIACQKCGCRRLVYRPWTRYTPAGAYVSYRIYLTCARCSHSQEA